MIFHYTDGFLGIFIGLIIESIYTANNQGEMVTAQMINIEIGDQVGGFCYPCFEKYARVKRDHFNHFPKFRGKQNTWQWTILELAPSYLLEKKHVRIFHHVSK